MDFLGSVVSAAASAFSSAKSSGGGTSVPRVEFDKMPLSSSKANIARDSAPSPVVGSQDPLAFWNNIFSGDHK